MVTATCNEGVSSSTMESSHKAFWKPLAGWRRTVWQTFTPGKFKFIKGEVTQSPPKESIKIKALGCCHSELTKLSQAKSQHDVYHGGEKRENSTWKKTAELFPVSQVLVSSFPSSLYFQKLNRKKLHKKGHNSLSKR